MSEAEAVWRLFADLGAPTDAVGYIGAAHAVCLAMFRAAGMNAIPASTVFGVMPELPTGA